MRFASLGSGSKGNATVVQAEDTLVMIDCGFSLKQTVRRLARLGIDPAQLCGILVTHEHTDHSSGVASLSKKFQIPVYLSYGTHSSGRFDGAFDVRRFNCQENLSIGALDIRPIAVPHDAREPCQYRLFHGDISLGILTDLGSITAHVVSSYAGCDGLLLEFNHDLEMLRAGRYPPQLKRRVAGDWGHLNNQQAAQLLKKISHANLSQIVVAHISENNNTRALAEQALLSVLPSLERVTFAEQDQGFDWLALA